jgi:hypothetical protein
MPATLPHEFANVPGNPQYFSDFIDFKEDLDLATTKWTFNVTNSTAPTTVDDAEFGVATFTNAGADNDRIEASRCCETFKLGGLGKTLWFMVRFRFSDATQADYGFGLIITDAAWLGDTDVASDGIWFRKDDGDTYLDLVYAYNAAAVADYGAATALTTVDTSWHTAAFRVVTDPTTLGKGTITTYYDGSPIGNTIVTTALPYDEELALSFGVQNGEASAKNLKLDYIGAYIER